MLLKMDILRQVKEGRVTLAFRRWKRPTVKAGGSLRTPVGVLAIEAVDKVDELDITDEAKDYIIDKGFNPDFGARPIKRAIERLVEDPLSEAILRQEFEGKNHIAVEVRDGELHFESSATEPEELEEVSSEN